MKYIVLLFFLLSCHGSGTNNLRSPATISELTQLYNVPGVASLTMMNDEVVDATVEGIKKVGSDALLDTNDKFHLGSCTKAMTATLAAIFIEEGLLDWSTPLSEIFPDIQMHPAYASMPFQTLLIHRAGIPNADDAAFSSMWSLSVAQGRKSITERFLTRAPKSAPDSRFEYTNYGYIIAGHALERISGETWENLMQKKLFEPLNMTTCGFGPTSVPGEEVPSQPWGHYRSGKMNVPRHFDNPEAMGPAATVHCSLPDWAKFLTIHMNGLNGEDNLLKANTFKKLHSSHPSGDSDYTYGGWGRVERSWAGGPALTHNGSNTLNYALVWIAPKKQTILMSVTNTAGEGSSAIADKMISTMIEKYLSP